MPVPPSVVPRAGLSSYAAGWQARDRLRQQRAAEWRSRMEACLPQVARMLADDFGATRVLLFGSFARGIAVPGSDIDLLVDGLPMERLIEATVRAERLLAEARVDLVPADQIRPEVMTEALAEGVLLHDGG
jgi:predicted nucleotidyltransferase